MGLLKSVNLLPLSLNVNGWVQQVSPKYCTNMCTKCQCLLLINTLLEVVIVAYVNRRPVIMLLGLLKGHTLIISLVAPL